MTGRCCQHSHGPREGASRAGWVGDFAAASSCPSEQAERLRVSRSWAGHIKLQQHLSADSYQVCRFQLIRYGNASLPADDTDSSPAAPSIFEWATCCAFMSYWGVVNGIVELSAAYLCHAHPADWLQPCPDTIDGPWLPAFLISLLSLVCSALLSDLSMYCYDLCNESAHGSKTCRCFVRSCVEHTAGSGQPALLRRHSP